MNAIKILLSVIIMIGISLADVPQLINYQGYLTDSDGNPLSGTQTVEFLIYDQAGGGDPVWSESQAINLNNGNFSTLLGSITPIEPGIFNNVEVYLAIKVGSDAEMVPRKLLTSVAYSFKAGNTDSLSGKTVTDFVQKGEVNSVSDDMISPAYIASINSVTAAEGNLSLVGGDHIEITDNPGDNAITISAVADEIGDNLGDHMATENIQTNGQWISADGDDEGIFVTEKGQVGVNTDTIGDNNFNVYTQFESSTDLDFNSAIFGHATNSEAAFNYGGYFISQGSRGNGVYAKALGEEGEGGVFSASGTKGIGVYGHTSGLEGTAVLGIASGYDGASLTDKNRPLAKQLKQSNMVDPVDCYGGNFKAWVDNSCGVYGYSSGSNSYGVYGEVYAPGDNQNYGGYFKSNGTQGVGVYGSGYSRGGYFRAPYDNGRGIYSYSLGDNAVGCYSWAGGSGDYENFGGYFRAQGQDGKGVYAYVSGQTGKAVYGYATGDQGTAIVGYSSHYAGYFFGDVNVDGTLTKTAGSFKIDHPIDPENQYLQHSFVESPDMKNVYDGTVLLEGNGEAVVTLPDYFEALNKDFRYQLTAIGAPGPNLYIAEKINHNQFKIAGGSAGMEVSWQVTGIRNDTYARNHRIEVEVPKEGKEQGKYLFPEEHNQPESMGIQYEEQQKMKNLEEKDRLEMKRMKNNR